MLKAFAAHTGQALAGIEDQPVIDKIPRHFRNPLASPAGNDLLFCTDVRHQLEKTATHSPANFFVQYDGGVG